ncbi:MAG: hypothetical protein Q9172_005452 [Xanthocarpia lactea]
MESQSNPPSTYLDQDVGAKGIALASSEDSLAEEDTETLEDDDTLATEEDTDADESDTGYDSGYDTSDSLERRAKKPKTAKSGKKTTGAGSGKKDTAASSGKKDTTADSGKKDTTATSGKKDTTASSGKRDTTAGSGKKDTTASSKDDSTTGSESTSAAEAASTTSSSSKDAGDAEEDSITTSEGDGAALDDSATDSESAGASEEETDSGSKGATNSQKGSAESIEITSCPLEHKGGAKGTAKDKTLGKRVPPPDVVMGQTPNYGKTWMGFLATEEVVSNDLIRQYARRGYEQIQDRFQGGDIIVAAFHISRVGVVVASSARAKNTEAFAVAERLKTRAQELIPAYWEEVKDRTHPSGLALAKWHAEDVAMVLGAGCFASGGQMKMATFGRYRPNAALGPKPPCSGTNAPTQPPCRDVLNAMEVSIVPLE